VAAASAAAKIPRGSQISSSPHPSQPALLVWEMRIGDSRIELGQKIRNRRLRAVVGAPDRQRNGR
jgi:hypothetical protein